MSHCLGNILSPHSRCAEKTSVIKRKQRGEYGSGSTYWYWIRLMYSILEECLKRGDYKFLRG